MKKLLFILPGPVRPEIIQERNRFFHLGKLCKGDIVQPSWPCDKEFLHRLPEAIPNFRYHLTYSSDFHPVFKFFWDFVFGLLQGIRIRFSSGRYDVIVTYGLTKTALIGYLLKGLTGAKLICEVAGNPTKSYLVDESEPSKVLRLKNKLSLKWINYLSRHVDRVHLLYPTQLCGLNIKADIPVSVFPEFTTVSTVQKGDGPGDYILFMGFPWFLKGVDVLLNAFNKIASDYPHVLLRIVGYAERGEQKIFEDMVDERFRSQVQFAKPVHHGQALELISRCKFLVLPSRTEAMGRVLIEAMAARRPVIASRVDGIPHYVKNDETGLLFEPENIEQLAQCMKRLLDDNEAFERLAQAGYDYVKREISETIYAKAFAKMIDDTVSKTTANE